MVVRLRAANVLLALVLVATLGCSFIPTYLEPTGFRAASYVPADTWLFSQVTLRPSLSQLAAARKIADTFASQPGWNRLVQTLNTTADPGGGNFATEVLSLLDGEVAIASSGPLSSSATPRIVALAHSSDADGLVRVLLRSVGTLVGTPTLNQGAKIYRAPGGIGLATLQGWLVVASSSDLLNETLNRIRGQSTTPALMDTMRFQALLAQLPADRLGMEYVDVGALAQQALVNGAAAAEMHVPPELLPSLSNVNSQVMLSFAAASSGVDIRVEGTSQIPPELAAEAEVAAAVGDGSDAFAHMPANTLVAYGAGLPKVGPEFDDALNQVLQLLAQQSDTPELSKLDLHISRWLGGSFGLGGAGAASGEASGLPDLFLVAQVVNPAAARADLASISQLLPPKTATPVSVGGFRFLQASAGDDLSVTYGVARGWLYATSGDATEVVNAAASGGLEGNERYSAMRSALQNDPVNLFVDVQGLRDLTDNLLSDQQGSTYASSIEPLVSPVTFLGGGARSDPNGDFHGHFVIGMDL